MAGESSSTTRRHEVAVYQGTMKRTDVGGFLVLKGGKPLSPIKSQLIRNHSPDGFSWGYGGSGPAQLALALLLEEAPEEIAVMHYQAFKWEVIAMLGDDWKLDSEQIRRWLANQ